MVEAVIESTDDHRGFVWGAFGDLREGLERLLLLNGLWSLTLLPGLLGLAFQEWPLVLRSVLVFLSAVAALPATLAVYALIAEFLNGEDVRAETVREAFSRYTRASFRSLAPLLVGLALLLWLSVQPLPFLLAVLLRLLLLLSLMTALYWGPLLARTPKLSALALLERSSRLVLNHPWPSLQLAAASLLTLVVAGVSIGGFFLASITLLALFQTRLLLSLRGTHA